MFQRKYVLFHDEMREDGNKFVSGNEISSGAHFQSLTLMKDNCEVIAIIYKNCNNLVHKK